MRIFATVDELEGAIGEDLGVSPWHDVTQLQVTTFGETTGDMLWIHTDPERAATSAYGTTIAHGYLTLSMLPSMIRELYRIEKLTTTLNYGVDRVRFPAPVLVPSRIRARAVIAAADRLEVGVRLGLDVTVEREGADKPVCVARTLTVLA